MDNLGIKTVKILKMIRDASKGEVTPIFTGVGTTISHKPDEPESVPVVPVVPAPALESAPLAQSVFFFDRLQKEELVQVQFEERNYHSYNYLIWKHDF